MLDKILKLLLSYHKEQSNPDLFTALLVFTSLVNKDKADSLRDKIMSVTTESPAYEWIKEEGKREGKREGIEQTALNFLKNGAPIDLIVKSTGLSKKQIERLNL